MQLATDVHVQVLQRQLVVGSQATTGVGMVGSCWEFVRTSCWELDVQTTRAAKSTRVAGSGC